MYSPVLAIQSMYSPYGLKGMFWELNPRAPNKSPRLFIVYLMFIISCLNHSLEEKTIGKKEKTEGKSNQDMYTKEKSSKVKCTKHKATE